MPVAVTYPGVYVEEIPSGVRTIVGVATSIGAFVDYFAAGPMNKAMRILSLADFENQYGGLDIRSEASYAIQQFFLNGGTEAYVVRVASATKGNAAVAAAIGLADTATSSAVLIATANSEGSWGNNLRLDVDYNTTDPSTQFNLTVTEITLVNGLAQIIATETFRNLVIDPTNASDVMAVVNAGSQLITISEVSTGKRPAQTGTASALAPDLAKLLKADTMDVSLGATKIGTLAGLPDPPFTMASLAAILQSQIRTLGGLGNATVSVVGPTSSNAYLVAKTGTGKWSDYLAFSDAGAGLAFKLGFDKSAFNIQQYTVGGIAAQAQTLPDGKNQQKGDDGKWDPSASGDASGVATAVKGDSAKKTGMYALLDVDLFNLLCLPVTANLPDDQALAIASAAESLCTDRRAFYLLDVPQQASSRDKVDAVMNWLSSYATLRSKNAALYFPRIDIPDPLNGFRARPTPPSGTIAGLCARTDGTRGVWKAPAGTEATLAGVQKLEYKLTDLENGVLNPLAINCLRNFPIYGPVCWGARTLNGADQMADDYKYIPVRRLALFIEESLYRGTQWVVFEPNDEPLWAQIRLNVGAFMHNLFRQGAFQGQTPQDAYFVKCDKQTTTQNDINLGIVNIIVGFAPLKPAEFVVIQIQQIAGQILT